MPPPGPTPGGGPEMEMERLRQARLRKQMELRQRGGGDAVALDENVYAPGGTGLTESLYGGEYSDPNRPRLPRNFVP